VISDSIARGLGDGAHFFLLMGVLYVFYAAWGHFMFGSASARWSDMSSALFSVTMFFMYDYDFDAMYAAHPVMARLFYASFMFLMTNLMLWMLLAIFLESYTEVRAESHVRGPSAFQELADVIRNGGLWEGCCGGSGRGGGGSGSKWGAGAGLWELLPPLPGWCRKLRSGGGGGGGSYSGSSGTGSAGYGSGGSDATTALSASYGGSNSSGSSSAAFLAGAAAAVPPPPQRLLAAALSEVRAGTLRTDERITVGGLAVALGVTPAVAARMLLDATRSAEVASSTARSRAGTEDVVGAGL